MKVAVCNDMDWIYSDEAFSIYSSCMYQPAYEDYKTQMRKYISDSSVKVFVCKEFGKKEGILVLGQSDSDTEIVGIAVSDNCQRCGIGRYMIHYVMEGLFCKGVSIVEYYENNLSIEEYTSLRTSVGWNLLHNGQMNAAIRNSLYTVKVVHEKQAVAMGRLIGDGMYYLIADIIVRPEYQKCGIGSKVIDMILEYVRKNTPAGGRSSVQLIAEKGKEEFYIKKGFKTIPHEFCGSGMRKVIRN